MQIAESLTNTASRQRDHFATKNNNTSEICAYFITEENGITWNQNRSETLRAPSTQIKFLSD